MNCPYCKEIFKKSISLQKHITQHIDRMNFIQKYIKYSMDTIDYINNVPKVVFICWFGFDSSIPTMTPNRFLAEDFQEKIKYFTERELR